MTPLLPLDSFRKELMLHPFHFWQLTNIDAPLPADCDALVREYGWQANDSAGREDVRLAIEQAEALLREQLGYSVAPRYVTETIRFPRYANVGQHRLGYSGADGRWLNVHLGEGRLIAAGVETRALIGTVTVAGASLVFSDADADGLNDTFTATIATTVTDPDEIALYFAGADRLEGEPVGERWRVQPVGVQIGGGTATIRGRYWTLARPILYQVARAGAINPATTANFAQSLEVYRRYTDPTGTTPATAQARLVWETAPWPAWATACGESGATFGDNSTDPAAEAYAVARVALRDPRRGMAGVGEATYNATTAAWESVGMSFCRPPDRIDVRYLAGSPLARSSASLGGQYDPKWARIVSRFAAALIGRRICGCESAQREFYRAQIDRAFAGQSNVEKFSLSADDLSNPFGTRDGAIAAWHEVTSLREVRGVLA